MEVLPLSSPPVVSAFDTMGWPSGPRPIQREILEIVFSGKDVLGVLPTGAGKTALYQVPAVARAGTVIVISPLIALMQDQVGKTQHINGVSAATLNSHCTPRQRREVLRSLESRDLDLLYISPERLQAFDKGFMGKLNVQMVAIDEAHCTSEWGHDFRPAYRRIGPLLDMLFDGRRPQTIALTATATKSVAQEIVGLTGLRNPEILRYSPNRPAMFYGVAGSDVDVGRMVARTGLPCLVYGSTRMSVEHAALQLCQQGYKADFYHAGRSKGERAEVQDRFLSGELEVIAATCAFGMGIDHGSLRGVVHLEMPFSVESYLQESGRAGRDGGPSMVICRHTQRTLDVALAMSEVTWPKPGLVELFWPRLKQVFSQYARQGSWEAPGTIQLTTTQLADLVGMPAPMVSSIVRILVEAGNLKRTSARELPVHLTLIGGRKKPRGHQQKAVLAELERHADFDGNVRGTRAFFSDRIGLDTPMMRSLNLAGILRCSGWDQKAAVLEQVNDGEATFDRERIISLGDRTRIRLLEAKAYLNTAGCRRAYLLNYFGDTSGGSSTGACCDRCLQRARRSSTT